LATNRSNLIRAAVEEYLKSRRRKLLEAELAAACEANAELGRQICEEFSCVDSENL
jgi:metal-responsive CopG/Arc/MetJ family transcriptional regulator